MSNIFILILIFSSVAFAGTREQATRLFDRLTSASLSLTDPRRAQMESMIAAGNFLGAAQIATQDDRFYNLTVRSFATPMSNRPEDPIVAQANDEGTRLTDFVAMVIGSTRDNMNAQELLNGDFTYYVTATITGVEPYVPVGWPENKHYDTADRAKVNLRQQLVRVSPQDPHFSDSAGVLTSHAWGTEHYKMGTNRRLVHYTLRQFLCTDIAEVRDTVYPTTRIRRDVDRAPGGDTTVFETKCRTCHGAMDGLAGAFAYYDFRHVDEPNPDNNDPPLPTGYFAGDQLMRYPNPFEPSTTVVDKYNQNSQIYPTGYRTIDDSWVNNFALSQSTKNVEIGWPSTMTSGRGPRSFGTMIANTKGFPVCMAKRVFKKVCGRMPTAAEKPSIDTLAQQFVTDGFKLKSLFERTAILPVCLGN